MTRVIYFAAVIIIAAGALEGSFRVFLAATGRPQSPRALTGEMRRTAGALTDVLAGPDRDGPARPQTIADHLHPYAGFEMDYGMDQTERDIERFRRFGVDPAVVEILILGGSVAGRFAANREAFEKRLLEDPLFAGRTLRVRPQARGAFKQPQQATFLAYLFSLGYRPHVVINIDGFNEVALAATNARHGVDPRYPVSTAWSRLVGAASMEPEMLDLLLEMRSAQRDAIALESRARALGVRYCAAASHAVLSALRRHRAAYLDAHERYLARMTSGAMTRAQRGLRFDPDADRVRDDVVGAWRQCSLSMHAMCEVRGIPYLHVLQPTLLDEGAKSLTEAERRAGAANEHWREAVRSGYPRLREGLATLAKWGVEVADLSRVFAEVPETIYIDSCHFEGVGHDQFARATAEALLDSLRPH